MFITKKLMFRKQSELTVTMEQPPAELVKPEPYQASCPILTATQSAF